MVPLGSKVPQLIAPPSAPYSVAVMAKYIEGAARRSLGACGLVTRCRQLCGRCLRSGAPDACQSSTM